MSMHGDRIREPDEAGLEAAALVLRRGGLVGMPTETVYGLAADACSELAVAGIFAAKDRPRGHPLIVHVASIADARRLVAAWPAEAEALARAFWPGPLTLVLPRAAQSDLTDLVTGGRDSVAVRMPAHPVALALLRVFAGPLAAPSANRHEHLSPTRAEHVLQSLGDRVELVLDGGPTSAGIESTLIDLTGSTPRVLRPGPIDAAALRGVAPSVRWESVPIVETGAQHSAPGLSRRHYAPRIPLTLLSRAELARSADQPGVVWLARSPGLPGVGIVLPDEPVGYAAGLYAALHELEVRAEATRILVESPPAGESWTAIADRLGRAASH